MRLSIIVAMAENGIIGRANALPWRLSGDLSRFRELTMGHHLIVGRRTFDSIGRPLAGRRMLVVSRGEPTLPPEVRCVGSMTEAVEIAQRAGDGEAFVGGGASIYEMALPIADRLYLTRILAQVEGDTSFPPVDWKQWVLVDSRTADADARNDFAHRFETWDRGNA